MANISLRSTIFPTLIIWINMTGCAAMLRITDEEPVKARPCERLCDTCSLCPVSQYKAEALACLMKKDTQSTYQRGNSTPDISSRVRVSEAVNGSAHSNKTKVKRQGVFICTMAAKIVFIDESGQWSEEIEHKNIKECSAIAYEKGKVYVIDRGGVIKTAAVTEEPYHFRNVFSVNVNRVYTYLTVDEDYGLFYTAEYRTGASRLPIGASCLPMVWIFKRRYKFRERKFVLTRVIKVQVHKQTRSVFYVQINQVLSQVSYGGDTMRQFKHLRITGCFQLYVKGEEIYNFGYDGTNIFHQIIYPRPAKITRRKEVVYKLRQQRFSCTFFWRVNETIGIMFFGKRNAFIIPPSGEKYDLELFPEVRSLTLIDD